MAVCLVGTGHSANVIASGKYALKQFRRGAATSFHAEVNVLRMLPTHKNKVEVIEVRTGAMQIVMKLYECDLLTLLQSSYPQGMPPQLAKKFYSQLIDALDFLHSNCVYHRDIKLDNLLVDGSSIRVCDFGLSVVSQKDSLPIQVNGTEAYMPPEMWEYIFSDRVGFASGEEYILSKADLYSAGICLYNLTTNELAFQKAHDSDPSYSLFRENVEQWWGYSPHDWDIHLKNLLTFALHFNPSTRLGINEIRKHDWYTLDNITL